MCVYVYLKTMSVLEDYIDRAIFGLAFFSWDKTMDNITPPPKKSVLM